MRIRLLSEVDTSLPALVELPHTGQILQYWLGVSVGLEVVLRLVVALHQVTEHHGPRGLSRADPGQGDQVLVAPEVTALCPEWFQSTLLH